MTYQEALEFIDSLSFRGSQLGLSRVTELLHRMGDPQKELSCIHVAGTNGKGSTSALLSDALTACGYRTGLFVSPHIERINERIQLNGCCISDDDFANLVEEIAPFVLGMEPRPTVFETVTAMAFWYFAQQKTDVVVLEVGLGGRLDATNVIDKSLLSVITAIDLDHTHILGTTVEEIAGEKAGIIKENGTVLFYGTHPDATRVIEARARECHADFHVLNMDGVEPLSVDLYGQTFRFEGETVRLKLLGSYQPYNASLALTAIRLLREKGFRLPNEMVLPAFSETHWMARFEILCENPPLIVDGGHNPHGVRATVESYRRLFGERKAVVVFGVMQDKDVKTVIRLLMPIAKTFYAVAPNVVRAMPQDALKTLLESCGAEAKAFSSVSEGVEEARKTGEIVLAVGSLYMAGEIRSAFSGKKV